MQFVKTEFPICTHERGILCGLSNTGVLRSNSPWSVWPIWRANFVKGWTKMQLCVASFLTSNLGIYFYCTITKYRTHLNRLGISNPEKHDTLHCIAIMLNWKSFNGMSFVFYMSTRFSNGSMQSIPKNYLNVVKRFSTDSSDYCCYSSFTFRWARDIIKIHLILHHSPEEVCNDNKSGDFVGQPVASNLPTIELGKTLS